MNVGGVNSRTPGMLNLINSEIKLPQHLYFWNQLDSNL